MSSREKRGELLKLGIEVAQAILMFVAFAVLIFGMHQFVMWGAHVSGPLTFIAIWLPLVFLAGYLFNRRFGGEASFW
jgi:hypothetical protein